MEVYPLVVSKNYGKSPFSMGKSTINDQKLWKMAI
jgi:hypothetical protein